MEIGLLSYLTYPNSVSVLRSRTLPVPAARIVRSVTTYQDSKLNGNTAMSVHGTDVPSDSDIESLEVA
ncbi:hypothetical protein PILCRDRAFT_820205 [Piloderma croceum F 1598]|uniref:Uncharacterized protein n=1 Tax=Piloderma croceum (strain F 1598) TaxID=765440 RepID=A0A0C3B9D3_PILCF|nr:hypothetical protein PILCRDRAFT_820205 [Piloderma croceum F 1598]